jgi:hypothetical protein
MKEQATHIRSTAPTDEIRDLGDEQVRRICRHMDVLSRRWSDLAVGESMSVRWPDLVVMRDGHDPLLPG